MIGWLVASVSFCLAGIGWWRSEQYRRLSLKNAQLARDRKFRMPSTRKANRPTEAA